MCNSPQLVKMSGARVRRESGKKFESNPFGIDLCDRFYRSMQDKKKSVYVIKITRARALLPRSSLACGHYETPNIPQLCWEPSLAVVIIGKNAHLNIDIYRHLMTFATTAIVANFGVHPTTAGVATLNSWRYPAATRSPTSSPAWSGALPHGYACGYRVHWLHPSFSSAM